MKRLLTLGCISWALTLALASAAQSPDRARLAAGEANNLQAIARNPGHALVLTLDGGAPFAENRELYDRAYSACRQALRGNPRDMAVRANLGGLYLWREAFHPDESGDFEKAIDQFLIVLSSDPGNKAVLTYLRSYEVLIRIRPEMAEAGMESIRSALQRTLKDPPDAANLRTFARFLFFDGHIVEARTAAESLTELAPQASSQLLLGAVELKSAHAEKALSAFQAALKLASSQAETATAKLGAAQAYNALKNTEAADRMLAEATASLPKPALEHAARAAGLDTPAELGWSIGKAYAASGNLPKAVDFLGPKEVSWLSSEMARRKNSEGAQLFNAHDLQGARRAFFSAAQMIPMEPVYWRNAAVVSFELGRYQESAMAFRKAAALEPLNADRSFGLAMSYAVIGNYREARSTFEKAARNFPADKSLAYWAVDLAYAVGGWKEALSTWSSLVRHGGAVPEEDWYDVFIHVRAGMADIAGRAEKRGARYQSLRHESVLYHILGEGLQRNLLSREGREQIRRERLETFNKILDNYRHLPLKPAIPPEVQALVLKAQPFLDSATNHFMAHSNVVDLYEQVIEAAPWWPEGHYMLALLACQNPSMYAYGELSNPDSGWVAGIEMNRFLALSPEGPEAARARKILKGCLR